MVFDFIKGAIGGAGAGSVFGPWGAGIGAVLGGVSSLGGGGGSGSSGGGGMDMKALQKALAAPKFLSDYTENLFNLDSNFSPGDYDRLLNAMNNPRKGDLDKYQVMNIFGQQGLNAGDKDYYRALTSTIGKPRGLELAGVVGQSMFRGATPTRKQTKDAYKYALLTGNTGTPQEAQQAMSSYFAQTNPKYRMPSSQELLAGMRRGPLVSTDSGVFLFGGTDRTNEMFDKLDDAEAYRREKIPKIYNT